MAYLQSEMKFLGSELEAHKQQSWEKITALEEEKRLLQRERDGLQDEITRLEAKALRESTANVQTMNVQNPEATEAGDCDPHYYAALDLFSTIC